MNLYPLVCEFETDEDALILYGQNGAALDASAVTEILPAGEQTALAKSQVIPRRRKSS